MLALKASHVVLQMVCMIYIYYQSGFLNILKQTQLKYFFCSPNNHQYGSPLAHKDLIGFFSGLIVLSRKKDPFIFGVGGGKLHDASSENLLYSLDIEH